MRLRFFLPLAALCATSALAQNHAPVFTALPNLTVAPGAAPINFYLTNNVSDPDLSDINGTQVKLTTTVGDINLEMFDSRTPVTVANFLSYVTSGKFTNVMWHRSIPGFVIQSGGYTYHPTTTTTVSPNAVETDASIQNEPGISNTRGTIAMARLGGQINSATSQFFINLADNGGAPSNLDTFDQGYAVFGRAIEGGMTIADFVAAVPRFNLVNVPKFNGPFPNVFDNLPLRNFNNVPIKGANVIFVNSATSGPKITLSATSDNPGIANPVLNGTNLTVTPGATGMATLTVTARDFNGMTATSVSTVSVGTNPPIGKLRNISTRSKVQTGEKVMIGGFVIEGTGTKRLLLRVIGTELSQFGVPNVLVDPFLELHDANSTIASNNTWNVQTNPADVPAIQATPYAPTDAQEPALLVNLPAGRYTAVVNGVGGTTGNALVEVQELDSNDTARLTNISTRGAVGTSDDVMIGGFIVNGTTPKRVIVRAVGPSLAPFLTDPLLNPKLEVYFGGQLIAQNDDWQLAPGGGVNPDKAAIIASGWMPSSDLESAVILTLPPGSYTAIVRGVNNTTGVGLVEVYDLD